MTSSDYDKLSRITSTQWGLVTAAQAEQIGISRLKLSRFTERGLLERLAHGVYRDAGAFETDYESIKVAWLSIEPSKMAENRLSEPEIIIGGTTAAMLLGCGDLEPCPYQFYTLKRRQTQRNEITFVRSDFEKQDTVIVDGLPVARIEYVIVDLIKRHYDLSLVLDVFKDARAWLNNSTAVGKQLNLEYLENKLDTVAKRNGFKSGAGFLEYMLESIGEGKKSYTETLSELAIVLQPINDAVIESLGKTFSELAAQIDGAIRKTVLSEVLKHSLNIQASFDQIAKSLQSSIGLESIKKMIEPFSMYSRIELPVKALSAFTDNLPSPNTGVTDNSIEDTLDNKESDEAEQSSLDQVEQG